MLSAEAEAYKRKALDSTPPATKSMSMTHPMIPRMPSTIPAVALPPGYPSFFALRPCTIAMIPRISPAKNTEMIPQTSEAVAAPFPGCTYGA